MMPGKNHLDSIDKEHFIVERDVSTFSGKGLLYKNSGTVRTTIPGKLAERLGLAKLVGSVESLWIASKDLATIISIIKEMHFNGVLYALFIPTKKSYEKYKKQ